MKDKIKNFNLEKHDVTLRIFKIEYLKAAIQTPSTGVQAQAALVAPPKSSLVNANGKFSAPSTFTQHRH